MRSSKEAFIMNKGKIIAVRGPVVDVQFLDVLPNINNALNNAGFRVELDDRQEKIGYRP